ncbi:MAG: peptidoglycan editing factor PgeF [Eubacteriales bacterium]|nr:peptidoglycan editing factor PgeF [Eubacteriales bacterium]
MAEWIRKPRHKEQLNIREKHGVTYLSFPALEDSGLVSHSFSTRLGGVSEGKFSSMNFTFTRGDNPEHVMENYRRMAAVLETDLEKMVLSHQTHTTNVRIVTEEDAGKGIVRDRDYTDVDGLVTNVPGITLVTFYADCVPLYLLDPVHRAIGLSHSGWRGTVNRMGQKTLETMATCYGTNPADVTACIGPSICQDCFEVGEEVILEFAEAFDPAFHRELFYKKENGKYQLDLWRANEIILAEAGIKEDHIHTTDICTHCNPELLFSHRTAGAERGNLAAFLCLREEI